MSRFIQQKYWGSCRSSISAPLKTCFKSFNTSTNLQNQSNCPSIYPQSRNESGGYDIDNLYLCPNVHSLLSRSQSQRVSLIKAKKGKREMSICDKTTTTSSCRYTYKIISSMPTIEERKREFFRLKVSHFCKTFSSTESVFVCFRESLVGDDGGVRHFPLRLKSLDDDLKQ
jgi:hypothetical protein